MGNSDKTTDIELRDRIATLLQQQGGVAGHQTAIDLSNAILRMVAGRPATASGGPPSTLPIAATTTKPE